MSAARTVERQAMTISAKDLPSLPTTLAQVLRLASDSSAGIAQLERLIGQDQALTLRLLQVANSPFYGRSREVRSIRHAVMVLGLSQLNEIVAALALAPAFAANSSLIDGRQLWGHALASALWSQRVAAEVGAGRADHLFTAALVHDIGIPILLAKAPQEFEACVAEAKAAGVALDTVERQRLNVDHAEVGAMVCEKWMLPKEIGVLVAGHHRGGSRSPDLHALAIGEYLARLHEYGEFAWLPTPEAPVESFAELGLGESALQQFEARAEEIAARVAAFAEG